MGLSARPTRPATIAQDPHECVAAVTIMASSSVEPQHARARVATVAAWTLATTTATLLRQSKRGGGGEGVLGGGTATTPLVIASLTTAATSASRTTWCTAATIMGTTWIARRGLSPSRIA